ncbi:MAG: DUF898 domain-containing protein [Xanthobacteraceae bacterium]|nr:DUF898 domain-containing protein [Xanthobacteraceae bacterium]
MTVAEAIVASTPDTPTAAPAAAPRVRFTGDTRAYWRLQLRGALLLAVTLGIYRFWLATDVRRFLWANTEVAGEPLEYTGTATELLVGFLIAIALLVPLNLVIAIAALGAGDLGALVSILALPLLFFLGQFAIYRARRYRLTRTVYRGVRCHQDGSALRYAVCAVFWWSLAVLTLGLAYPFALSRLERFKLRHTYFGDLKGRFEGSGLRLLLRGLPMWLLVIGPLAFAAAYTVFEVEWPAIIAAGSISTSTSEFLNAIEGLTNLYAAIILCVTALVFSVVAAAVLFPVFQAMVLRWWIGGLRLGGLTIHSQLRTAPIYGGYLRFLGFGLLFVVAMAVTAGLATALSFLVVANISNSVAAEAINATMAVGIYVITMLGFSAIYQVTVKLTLWRAGMESITLDGADVLERVKAEGALSSAVGEGLADALNMGGI